MSRKGAMVRCHPLRASRLVCAFVLGLVFVTGCAHQLDLREAQRRVLRTPGQAQAWIELGDAYARNEQPAKARDAWEQARQLDPDNPALNPRLDNAGPLDEYERQVLQDPANDEVWGDLGDHYRGRDAKEHAIEAYRQALRLDPTDSEWREALQELGATQALEELLAEVSSRRDLESRRRRATLLSALGREAEALEAYIHLLEREPGDEEARRAALSLATENEELMRVLERHQGSNNDEVVGLYALTLMYSDDKKNACPHFDRAHQLDPDDEEWSFHLAAQCGREELGGPDALAAGDLDPLSQSLQLYKVGNKAAAMDVLETLLMGEPEASGLQPFAAKLAGKTPLELIGGLTGKNPDNDELWGDYADELFRAQRYRHALEIYRKALALDPTDQEWRWKINMLTALLEREAPAEGEPEKELEPPLR